METDDKTYMWLTIIAFIALCIACGFALAELNDLKSENANQVKNPFESVG